MKILITGKTGKVSGYMADYISEKRKDILVSTISLRSDEWKKEDFTGFDVIAHVAGITHSKDDSYEEFYKINTRLTEELFNKATRDGVKQFIYLSSMAVFDGTDWGFGDSGIIKEYDKPMPKSNYGKSKALAEKHILSVTRDTTLVSIVRPPSIIGNGMERYFDRYIKLVNMPIPFAPYVHAEAKRSLIHIQTLTEYILYLIDEKKGGIFMPQSLPALSVSEMIEVIAGACNRKKRKIRNPFFIPNGIQKRFFGQIYYDISYSARELEILNHIPVRDAILLSITK